MTLDLYPWIATALPEVNENATEFTFKLRKDVTYSDGSHVNAANVVRNFDLFGLGDEGRRFAPSPALPHYQRAEALDAYTVKFYFSEPTPEFPQAVSMPRAGLLADATLKRTMEGFGPGHATDIVASGPFVVSDERVGEELTLTARDDYNWAPAVREHEGPQRLSPCGWCSTSRTPSAWAWSRAGRLILPHASTPPTSLRCARPA